MKLKIARFLVERKLCAFNELARLFSDGDVMCYMGYSDGSLRAFRPTDPNDTLEFYHDDYAEITHYDLHVKNRGKTRIHKPYYESEFLRVRNYDYGDHKWDVVERANAIVAVPILDGHSIVLVKIYRPALSEWLYELPAGMMEGWEQAHDTALRELEEETGYTAKRVDFLFSAYSSPGFCTEMAHFYLCSNLIEGEQCLDPEEKIEPFIVPLAEAQELIKQKEIIDMKTICAISYIINYYQALGDTACVSNSVH